MGVEAMDKFITGVAMVCHEANRAYCETIGDKSQKPWADAEFWQQNSAAQGVRYRMDNPNATPKDQHDSWCQSKIADGWVYGEVKDAAAKTHPCLVPYNQLPVEQQAKDALFVAVCNALIPKGLTE